MTKLIFTSSEHSAKSLSKQFLEGKLRRVYHGIYTDDLKEPIEQLIQKEWMVLVPHLVPKGILSFRTAYELKPALMGDGPPVVYVTSTYVKKINLPGLRIHISKGNTQDYIELVSLNLARSNEARLLLENLSGKASVGQEAIEGYLTRILRTRGESILNRIRDQAKSVAMDLNYQKEYQTLNKIISALLTTHPGDEILKSRFAKAQAKKEPYDEERIQLFQALSLYLKRCQFKNRPEVYHKTSFNNLSFFESYFSNYIEGTRFSIDEAENIVFKNEEIKNRHADSHDVLALYYLTNDYSEISLTPRNMTEFISLLQERHHILMQERPDKRPGEFKKFMNIAGNTSFVRPNEVIGTLTLGFDIYTLLQPGMERALFMHFLISEVHPFEDGNGRISRLMMNAELVNAQNFKIIIPTVHRDNYLNGLRRATRDQYFLSYCKVMDQAQAYTATVPWHDYGEARDKLEADCTDKTPDEGLPIFNRVIREMALSEFP